MIVFQENQLEPMDGRKGLTSGWNLLGDTPIGTTIFLDWVFFPGKIPPIGTTGWKEGVN